MSEESVPPETSGVGVALLATVDLGPEIRAWRDSSFGCEW